jgi:hypothetical protein
MTSCHKLEKMSIVLPVGHLQLAQENLYLAAIRAIDPDFMILSEGNLFSFGA